jgi:hypothetical protein
VSPAAQWPHVTSLRWDDTHRLIPETYADTTEPFLAALVDSPADVEALTKIAARTSGRTLAQNGQLPSGPGPHDLVFDVPFSKIINGAFSYPGNKGGRFNTNTWGAWYAGKSLRTSVAEVTFHRSVLLTETAASEDEIEYVDFLADIHGSQFADLRDGSRKSLRCLDPASHVHGQALAHELLANKLAGVVYPSVRHLAGECVAVLRPPLVGNVRVGARYRFTWSASAKMRVRLAPSESSTR